MTEAETTVRRTRTGRTLLFRPRWSPRWRLRDLQIALRLRLAFILVLLLMATGAALALWQFRAIGERVKRVSQAEERAAAILRINNSVLTLMSRLHRAAEDSNREQFEREAKRLLKNFREENSHTLVSLQSGAPEADRQRLAIDSLQEMINALPSRIDSLVELARAGDWPAVHARLTDQVDHTDEVGERLMQEITADLAHARENLFQDFENAGWRAGQTLMLSGLLALLAAGVLGVVVTNSIVRPLAELDRGALRVARGDFRHEINVTGTDELAHVGTAFNRMTKELADLYARESRARETAEHLNQTLRLANQDLSVFAYSASHDLQEPLRSINLYSQLLQRQFGHHIPAEANEYVNQLADAARRMSELIKDLLAYMEVSSTEGGTAELTPAEAAVQQALANLRAAVEANHAVIDCDALPAVPVQGVHLQQLFQNLIGNAIKYRSEDQPTIRISAREQDGFWQFSVTDNGIGIDPQYRTQVFKLFQRLHAPGSRPGTGVGLAICQKIVERYGGQIWVESASGRGSDFRFTLPRNRSERPLA